MAMSRWWGMNGWPSAAPIPVSSPPNDSRSGLRLVAYFGEQLGKSRVGGAVIVIRRQLPQHHVVLPPQSRIRRVLVKRERHRAERLDGRGVDLLAAAQAAQLPQRLLQLAMVRSPHARPPRSAKNRRRKYIPDGCGVARQRSAIVILPWGLG